MEPVFKNGLLPAVLQHWRTDEVLMLGFMNREAWERTLEESRVWFFSRSKDALWLKGATSGNYQAVREILLDCDRDAVLIKVEPAGPVCHTGKETCFHEPVARNDEENPSAKTAAGDTKSAGDIFEELFAVIRDRKSNPPQGSYTAKLFRDGREKICRKVGEEATETVVAGLSQSDERVVSESADLIYHLFVLLAERGIALGDVSAELSRRRK